MSEIISNFWEIECSEFLVAVHLMFLREILLAIQCDQRSTYCFILRDRPSTNVFGTSDLYCRACDPEIFLYCGTGDPWFFVLRDLRSTEVFVLWYQRSTIFSNAGPAIFAGRAIQKLFCIAGPAIHKWIVAPGEFVCYSDAGPEILNFKNIAGCAIYEFFGQSSFPRVATETRTFSVIRSYHLWLILTHVLQVWL